MSEFLKVVAGHYFRCLSAEAAGGVETALSLSDYLFVFPNRRAGLFFRHYLASMSRKPIMAPAMTTVGELFARLSPRLRVADRTELLFRLYGIYQELSGNQEEFDNFVFWGDMLLSDFDEIDKYRVDAREILYNIRDLKEIDAAYADFPPEVVAAIRSFWTNFIAYNHQGRRQDAFTRTWNVLYDLYERFRAALAAEGLAYEGMMMREVVDRLSDGAVDAMAGEGELPYRKVVFVGLAAIDGVTRALMRHIVQSGRGEVCWDYADPRFTDPESAASYFTERNLADFPNALSDEEMRSGVVADEDKEIEVCAVSSGVGQARRAGDILRRWVAAGYVRPAASREDDGRDAIHTAVVLPDEKLLIPMLYAVPEEFEPFNVTMGYGLKSTPVAAFVDAVMRLQTEASTVRDGGDTFYYRSAQALLAHHYLVALCGTVVYDKSERITTDGLLRVPVALFADSEVLRTVFRRVTDGADAARYLQSLFALLLGKVEQDEASADDLFAAEPTFSSVEREFLFSYAHAVDRLVALVGQYPYAVKVRTFFRLLTRLVSGEKVAFTGEPLAGLQVMGVLETRAVDFDNVVVLSMNEGVFPARTSDNTFIPVSLRAAFGLPTPRQREAVYAGHFYRLISRARRLAFLCDVRTEGVQTGEMSRYLLQLRHLYSFPQMKFLAAGQDIGFGGAEPAEVVKDSRVRAQLDRYRSGGDLVFSATALKDYVHCPMKFYLSRVALLREEDELSEGVDSSQLGTIFHEAMRHLYDPLRGRTVTSDFLKDLAKDDKAVDNAVAEGFAKAMHGAAIEGYFALVVEIVKEYVRNVLAHDARIAPFTYLASEFRQTCDYRVSEELTVQLKCFYDRIDIDRDGRLRIVDYKTGGTKRSGEKSKLAFASIAGFFDPDDNKTSDEAFQTLMYCLMFGLATPDDRERMGLSESHRFAGLSPHLYFIRDFHHADTITTVEYAPDKNRTVGEECLPVGPVVDYAPFAETFGAAFRAVIAEIYSDRPFTQCEDVKTCRYCPYRALCGRDDT